MPARMSTMTARLTMLRNDRKLTQAEFADRLGIARSSYKNYETGARPLPFLVIEQLVLEEGVDARWLIAGRSEILTPNSDQLVRDCMMLRSIIDAIIELKKVSLSDDQKSDIIMMMIQRRSEQGEISFYDRDYLSQLIQMMTRDRHKRTVG